MAGNSDNLGETQPLLVERSREVEQPRLEEAPRTRAYPRSLRLSVLLAGAFIANLDTSFVIATYHSISSDFGTAALGSWILVGYTLGYSIALPIYGAFGDLYGSILPLILGYCLFGAGCVVSAIATRFWQVVLGRMVAGIGAAGMTSLVAVIIAESSPPAEVAVLRSYVNVVAIVGRSSGGPIGAVVTDAVGWRWSFAGQVPFVMLCCFAVSVLFKNSNTEQSPSHLSATNAASNTPKKPRFNDFGGILTFAMMLTSLIVALEYLGPDSDWRSPVFITSISGFVLFGVGFLAIEIFHVDEPLVPFRLLNGGLGIQMIVQTCLLFAQFSIVSQVGGYFVRIGEPSNILIAVHLVPVAVGNAVGALSAGNIIKRTKHYKLLSIFGLSSCSLGFCLMAARWNHPVNAWESLYITLTSLGVGIVNSTQFVALSITAPKNRLSSLVSIFFLSQQTGMMLGASGSSALLHAIFRRGLTRTLDSIPGKAEVIQRILNDTSYALTLPTWLQNAALSGYFQGFTAVCVMSAATSFLMLPLLIIPAERVVT